MIERIAKDFFTNLKPRHECSNNGSQKFVIYQSSVQDIFGPRPSIKLALEAEEALYHEAGVFIPDVSRDTVFVTSNLLKCRTSAKARIEISKLTRENADHSKWNREEVKAREVVMANGATNHHTDGVLFCAQGDQTVPSQLVVMDTKAPHTVQTILSHFHGRHFNSINDVVVAADGAIWFTDPTYGYEQGFRGPPQLPSQVYRYDPALLDLRAMADGFGKPNGLCFSPDERTLYVTDTEWISGDGATDDSRASHIYAYSVIQQCGGPFLTNKRLFAMADTGVPDGIKCDTAGNVYSGCGDGINIWAPNGCLLGKIIVPGGVTNFCFGRPGEMFLLNEKRFWVVSMAPHVKGMYFH